VSCTLYKGRKGGRERGLRKWWVEEEEKEENEEEAEGSGGEGRRDELRAERRGKYETELFTSYRN